MTHFVNKIKKTIICEIITANKYHCVIANLFFKELFLSKFLFTSLFIFQNLGLWTAWTFLNSAENKRNVLIKDAGYWIFARNQNADTSRHVLADCQYQYVDLFFRANCKEHLLSPVVELA